MERRVHVIQYLAFLPVPLASVGGTIRGIELADSASPPNKKTT
jgi:hypothetical protein